MFLEQSLRDSPKSGSYGKFSDAYGTCSKITTNPEPFCLPEAHKFFKDL
jgi:hypothetical protein